MTVTTLDPVLEALQIQLNAQQRLAVRAEAPVVAVEAGAGTGKTTVLAQRYAWCCLAEGADPGELLALTFTNRAAGEMQARVRKVFTEALDLAKSEVATGGGITATRCRQLLRALDGSAIGTIHANCARLLRRYAVQAGVDARFRELDEPGAVALKQQLAEACLREWPHDAALREDFARVFSEVKWYTGERGAARAFCGSLVEVYDEARVAGLGRLATEQLVVEPPRPRMAELFNVFLELWDGAVAGQASFAKNADAQSRFADFAVLMPGIVAAWESGDLATVQEGIATMREQNRRSKKGSAGTFKHVTEYINNELDEEFMPLVTGVRALGHAEALARLLIDFDARYAARKQQEGVLDFEDLQFVCIDLLAREAGVRGAVRRGLHAVLVDEFQDTSPVQLRLLELLTGANGCHPESGTAALFVVGDPKQSIYRFRHADLPAYDRFLETTAGTRIPLVENYRSVPGILAAANTLLAGRRRESILRDPEEQGAPLFTEEVALRPARAPESPSPAVELLLGVKDEVPAEFAALPGDERRTGPEWQAACALVRCQAWIEATGKAWKDVAVLARSGFALRAYERACRRLQIPYVISTSRGFFEAREVRDVLQLLRVMEHPADDLAVAALLRGPLGGLSVEGLYALTAPLRGSAPRPTLWSLIERAAWPEALAAQDRETLDRVRMRVPAWRLALAQESLAAWLERIYREGELLDMVLAERDGLTRLENLRALQSLARGFDSGEPDALGRLARALEEYEARDLRMGAGASESGGREALQLMTIHAAKGLEWPCVVLTGLEQGRASDTERLGFSRDHGLGFEVDLEGAREYRATYSRKAAQAWEKAASGAERHRMLYVALTRAQDHLLLAGQINPDAKIKEGKPVEECASWLEELRVLTGCALGTTGPLPGGIEAIAPEPWGAQVLQQWNRRADASPTGEAPSARVVSLWEAAEGRLAQVIPDHVSSHPVPVTAIADFAHCPALHHLRHAMHLPAPSLASGEHFPRRELGALFHALMQRFPWSDPPALPEWLAEQIPPLLDQRGVRGEFQREATVQLSAWVAGVLQCDLIRDEIGPAERVWTEYPLVWSEGALTLQGRIDLCWRRADGAWGLADYKTATGELGEGARLQVGMYAAALGRLTGASVRGWVLQPDASGAFQAHAVGADVDWNGALAAYARGGAAARLGEHCMRCDYRTVCTAYVNSRPAQS